MSKLDYNSLASKVRSIDPYRGTMRYPMDNRSNRQNIVELVDTGDDIEFHVSHGYRYKEIEISEARYKMLEGVCGAKVFKKEYTHQEFDFFTMDIKPRVLCIVRSDNTMEYVNDSYYQGDNMKISDWSNGYQYDSYRMSGTAFSNNRSNHPVFKGLRVNVESRQPTNQNIQVFRRTVNRKKSMELMLAYKDAFKSPDALLKCMDVETMVVSAKDILAECAEKAESKYLGSSSYFKLAEECFAKKENFEAVVLYAVSLQMRGFNQWTISNYDSSHRHNNLIEPKNLVPRIMTSLSKRLYREHKPFDEQEVDFNNAKGSEWGLRIAVDGVDILR